MRKTVKNVIRSGIQARLKWVCTNDPGERFYSQEGEDIIASRILGPERRHGTYVDVGCNHPVTMSNTYFFYKMNWSGIVIDPNPSFKQLFQELRPRDTFVNMGISEDDGQLTYYQFEEPLLNTFNKDRAIEVAAKHSALIGKQTVSTRTLDFILRSQWPRGKEIDFLSIDCEGLDLSVLRSHNFNLFPAKLICIEIFAESMQEAIRSEISGELQGLGYVFVSRLRNSCIFKFEAAK